jgi:checkpoint serine/threonine-protein kinase
MNFSSPNPECTLLMTIGLMVGGSRVCVFQSLARIAESHIVIAPSKHQVIVNPVSGRRERVFVNLEAVYPTPEEPGTELSFEELWAASQGWLDCCWEDESELAEQEQQQSMDENNAPVDMLSQQVATKLVVHHDVVMLDENGAIKDHPRPSKSKKKKVMEVNETQISKSYYFHLRHMREFDFVS